MRDGVHHLQIRVRTTLDNAAAELGFFIRIFEIDNRKWDSRITPGISCRERILTGTNNNAIIFTANPYGDGRWRAVGMSVENAEIRSFDEIANFFRECDRHEGLISLPRMRRQGSLGKIKAQG